MPSGVSSARITNRTIGPPSSIAALSGFVRPAVIEYSDQKAPRRGGISAGQSAGNLWEDLLALMLFKVVTTGKQLDINVDKIQRKHGRVGSSRLSKKSPAQKWNCAGL
jgi:hypothetical protein